MIMLLVFGADNRQVFTAMLCHAYLIKNLIPPIRLSDIKHSTQVAIPYPKYCQKKNTEIRSVVSRIADVGKICKCGNGSYW